LAFLISHSLHPGKFIHDMFSPLCLAVWFKDSGKQLHKEKAKKRNEKERK
jgi:hypothetical protein